MARGRRPAMVEARATLDGSKDTHTDGIVVRGSNEQLRRSAPHKEQRHSGNA